MSVRGKGRWPRGLRKRGKIWWIRYYRSGTRYEESSGSEKQGEAQKLLDDRRGAIAKGKPVTPQMTRLTFEEAAADIETDYKLNGYRTLQVLQIRIKHLATMFTGWRMASITEADVKRYEVRRQEQGASIATVNRELSVLVRMFTLAVEGRRLLADAVPKIERRKEHNIREGFFDRKAFDTVCAHLPARVRGAALFGYLTGWRVKSEVLSLQWRQIDFAGGTVRLESRMSKTEQARVFPFDVLPELGELLARQWASKAALEKKEIISPWVFHRGTGAQIKSFRKAWAKACTRAGVPGRLVHDLRRTAVRNLVRAGVPEQTAMRLTGHKTRAIFDRYDIVNEADLRDAVRKLARPMFAPPVMEQPA